MPRRLATLVVGCIVLGIGVGLLLRAALGSDGYSTLINGLSLTLDVPFVLVNWTMGAILVAAAWARGTKPGIGTIAQPLIVGSTVNIVLDTVAAPHGLVIRLIVLAVAFVLLTFGVAVYLSPELGSGPVGAAARAWDPPLAFAYSYSVIQAIGAVAGFALGASIGIGTILIVVGVGPAVKLLNERAKPVPAPG